VVYWVRMTSLAGLSRVELDALMSELGEPPYRAKQVHRWVHVTGAKDYDSMTSLPRELRARLAERLPVRETAPVETHRSDDGTVKLLLGLADGERVECVWIPEGDRSTFCISSQVGCGVGCVFCASGAEGVVRNLTDGEIYEQALWLKDLAGRPTNVVMMGMGEPLHNVKALAAALRRIQDPRGFDLGARRITISTSGPKPGFEQLLAEGLRVKLAISLHAATDPLRSRLVPRGGTGTVTELADMAQRWFEATGRDVTYEYVLIEGVNDRDEDARALAELGGGPHRNVNLIPMNPVPFAPDLRPPPPERVDRFAKILEAAGCVVHVRRQRGDDVAAACGQLRLSRFPAEGAGA